MIEKARIRTLSALTLSLVLCLFGTSALIGSEATADGARAGDLSLAYGPYIVPGGLFFFGTSAHGGSEETADGARAGDLSLAYGPLILPGGARLA